MPLATPVIACRLLMGSIGYTSNATISGGGTCMSRRFEGDLLVINKFNPDGRDMHVPLGTWGVESYDRPRIAMVCPTGFIVRACGSDLAGAARRSELS